MTINKVGVIGAGKLGVTLAQLALKAGYEVYIAGSGSPDKIRLTTRVITPGAVPLNTEEVVDKSDIIILALPLSKFRSLDPDLFGDKLVLDGMNHWFEIDGPLEEIVKDGQPTTLAVQQHLHSAHVVKAFNHMGYHHLRDEAKLRRKPGRKAIAFATNKANLKDTAAGFIDSLGFDPLFIGNLKSSKVLETGQPAFGAHLAHDELAKLISQSNPG